MPSLPPLPIPFARDSADNDAEQLCCPACGDIYVHIVNAKVRKTKADYFYQWVKGDVVTIYFSCENGEHHFSLEFGFHKGFTFLQVNPEEWKQGEEV